jgi:hypothetical protein
MMRKSYTSYAILITLAFGTAEAAAQPYAHPPGHQPEVAVGPYVPTTVSSPLEDEDSCYMPGWRRHELSPFRVHVGGATKFDADGIVPGVIAAIDVFRGPAGFRASGAWLRVGSDDGVAQYTGELTLDLGGCSDFRPVIGAGGGFARTYRVDDMGNRTSGGASMGVGLLRGALEYRLPIDDVDSRAGLSVMGVLPAIRGDGAPDIKGWILAGLTLGIGF